MPGTSAKITPITSAPCIVKSSLYSPRSSSKTSPMSGMFDIVASFLESDKYLLPWYSSTAMLLKRYDTVAVAVSTSLTQSVRGWLYLFCLQCLALLNHWIHEQVVWLNYNLSHDWYTVIWLSLLEFRMVGFVSFSMSVTIIFLGDFSIRGIMPKFYFQVFRYVQFLCLTVYQWNCLLFKFWGVPFENQLPLIGLLHLLLGWRLLPPHGGLYYQLRLHCLECQIY